ncbi:2,5-dichloro-2,5-cyclohexadiene-1,4-diol dehydrogenase [subsurface metagenome]|jgi:NAD(P)-dependent dehydrogenase (short-subunit alcohol dehydrogenase family)
MVKLFQGKVALVTGGGTGIGRVTALAFASEGAKVVVADINVENSQVTVSVIINNNGEGLFIKTDVSNAIEVEAMVNKVVETYGRLDYAFNNAGIGDTMAYTADLTEEEWDRTINVNLKGVWVCMKYEIKQMLKQGGGAIVNMASVIGLVGLKGSSVYTASKGGVVQLTRTAALEYARSGIRINALCPSFIATPMNKRLLANEPELEKKIKTILHPVGRLGEPEEVAEAVIWLCSDRASFVTGHPLVVDGGYLAQ